MFSRLSYQFMSMTPLPKSIDFLQAARNLIAREESTPNILSNASKHSSRFDGGSTYSIFSLHALCVRALPGPWSNLLAKILPSSPLKDLMSCRRHIVLLSCSTYAVRSAKEKTWFDILIGVISNVPFKSDPNTRDGLYLGYHNGELRSENSSSVWGTRSISCPVFSHSATRRSCNCW